ncbi:MAG TPA: ABC transporter substrate-binding protein [Candidatus Eisenbacteria bacterium]|nr:ABC transporter substrate-binding protein [Candidatus Eisenbacteria bacterium]
MVQARRSVGRSAALAAILAAGLVAAGCGTTAPGATTGAGSSPAADLSKISVSYLDGLKGIPFFTSVHCGAQARATELGIKYDHDGPAEFDPTQQIPLLNAIGARKPSALIISPTDTQALIAPLKGLVEQGIKIVTVDTTVNDESVAVSRIISDNAAGGKLGAETLNQLTGGKGSVVVLSVKPGISTTDERAAGFTEAIKAFPTLKFLGVEYNQGTDKVAQEVVTGLIAREPDLSGIFIVGNVGSEGAAAALRAANVNDRVKVVQYDASPPQVDQLKQGILDALIAQDPYQEGVSAIDQAVNAVQGKPVEKVIQTGLNVITKESAADGSGLKYQYKTEC